MSDESHQASKKIARYEGVNRPGYVTALFAGDPGAVRARNFHSNVAARIAHADDEHAAIPQLRRVLVIVRMQLHDARIEFTSERRNTRLLVVGHSHDDVVRFEAMPAGAELKASAFFPQSIYLDTIEHG